MVNISQLYLGVHFSFISKNNSLRPERQVRLIHLTPKTSIANQDET